MYRKKYNPQDDEEDILEKAMREASAKHLYERRLSQHPDCRDPDHPGCPHCQEDEDWED